MTSSSIGDGGIPYFFGMLIGPAGLYVRAKIVDTPEFLAAEKPETMPIKDVLRRHPLAVLLALGISIISNSSFYILAYIPTYGVKTLHLPQSIGSPRPWSEASSWRSVARSPGSGPTKCRADRSSWWSPAGCSC